MPITINVDDIIDVFETTFRNTNQDYSMKDIEDRIVETYQALASVNQKTKEVEFTYQANSFREMVSGLDDLLPAWHRVQEKTK